MVQVLHIKTMFFGVKESKSEVQINVHACYMPLHGYTCTCMHATCRSESDESLSLKEKKS